MRPININTNNITSTVPRSPEGPYPQLRACGQEGKAPTRSRISMMSSIVESVISRDP